MRTLDSALTTAQQSASREPYVRIYADDGAGTTHTFSTTDVPSQVVYVEQWEEPYAGVAIIRLSNYDGFFSAKDLRGYEITIGWGYVLDSTPDSTWYSNTAPMKALLQRDTSYEGHVVCELYCVSKWAEIEQNYIFQGGKKLSGELTGAFQLGELVTGGTSSATGRVACVAADYIVVTRVTGTFQAAETCTGGTSAASISSIAAPTDNYGALVYAAGDTTTEARIEALTGLTVDVDEDDDLGSMADSPKLEVDAGTSVRQVIRRMLLRSKCGMRYENDEHLHVLYLDTTDASQYRFAATHAMFLHMRERSLIIPNTVYVVSGLLDAQNAPAYIGTANDATSVAALGTLVAPVQIDTDAASQTDVDNRAAAWVAQQVAQAYQGQIVAPLECGLEVYDMVSYVDTRLNTISSGRIGRIERIFEPDTRTYEVRINLGSLYSVPGAMDVGPDSRDNDLRDLSTNLDRTPPSLYPPLASWQLLKHLLPYTIGVTFTATDDNDIAWGAGTITFADGTTQSVDAGTLNLANANPYYIYCDLNDAAPATLKNTQTFGDSTGGERVLLAFAVKGANTSTKALIVAGTKGPKLFVDTLSSITGNFGLITAGEVRIGTGTLGSNFTGWRLWVDTSVGRIAGYASDVIQWYTDTDGQLYCGVGSVVLNTDGISIDGEYLLFIGGVQLGKIKQIASTMYMVSTTDIRIDSDGDLDIGSDIDPLVAGTQCLGNDVMYWGNIHYKNLIDEGCPLPLVLSSLQQIKSLRTKARHISLTDVEKEKMGDRARERVEASDDGEFEEWDLDSFPEEVLRIPKQEERDAMHRKYLEKLKNYEEEVRFFARTRKRLPPKPEWNEPKNGIVLNEFVWVLTKAVKELAEKVEALERSR